MARDQRTRLNADLAHQYGAQVPSGAKKPGKGSGTENLADGAEQEEAQESERDEEVATVEGEQHVAAEPKKSIFELPRKEPSRPSLLPDDAPVPAPPKK